MIHQTRGDRIFDWINHAILFVVLLLVLYPLWFVVIASISDPSAVRLGQVVLWPQALTLQGYEKIYEYKAIWIGYRNTLFYTVVGATISVTLTITAAYPLSFKRFMGRNIFTFLFAITMFFSGGLIPTYLVIRDLGMINTVWALLIPGAVGFWSIIIVRTFYSSSIPEELKEAARIDGCNDFRMFLSIVLPLSRPIIAVMFLFAAVGQWNAYFNAMIYLQNRELYPLQLILREILVLNEVDRTLSLDVNAAETFNQQVKLVESIKYGAIIVSSLPIIMLYPFLQRYFVKGILVGSIKG